MRYHSGDLSIQQRESINQIKLHLTGKTCYFILFLILCHVSLQSQQTEFHLIITNRLFNMWSLFSRARLLVRTCNAPLTHHIKKKKKRKNWSGFFNQALRKLNISSLKFEIISIFRHSNLHACFNEIVALNSTSQFVKGIFYIYIYICCPAVLHCAAGQILLRKI